MTILNCMLIVFLYIQHFVHCTAFPSFTKLTLPPNVTGPEAIAFDAKGGGPYTGVADGRILKYQGPKLGFIDFATTSPFRTKKQCDGTNSGVTAASNCGRPLGLSWNFKTDELYIADIKFGFLVVSRNGGLATTLATGFNDTPFGFPNAVDIDQQNQIVYFTDAGQIFNLTITQIVQSGDSSGKLYKYDIKTKKLSLLLGGLSVPNGVAVSKDGTYLVISEFIRNRIRIFWLKGANAFSSKTLINLQGRPDNIKRTLSGDFWVPVSIMQPLPSQAVTAIGLRFKGSGKIVESVDFTPYYNGNFLTEVQEYFGRLYLGSGTENFVGKYKD